MKFTRSQFAKTFGVSMESLRYLEKNGILQVARNEDNQYMEYTEDQIPIVLSIKKFQQAGIPLEEILPLTGSQVPDHAAFLERCIAGLTRQKEQIEASLGYLRFIQSVYRTEIQSADRLRLKWEGECFYLRFDPKGKNTQLIREAMQYLPHVDLMTIIDLDELDKPQPQVQLGLNLPLYIDSCKPLIETVAHSNQLHKTADGTYLYKVIFKENILRITRVDVEDMLDYAAQHQFVLQQEIFGFVMGPEIKDGRKGFYIRLYCLMEKDETDLAGLPQSG